jgi:hypothetical protein
MVSIPFISSISVLDFVSVGSVLSCRSFARFGSALSIYGMTKLGSAWSCFNYSMMGSSLSLRAFTRLGSIQSCYGIEPNLVNALKDKLEPIIE